MPFFNVGDKIYNKKYPNKIYTVKKRTDITHCIPNYILVDEKGEELNNFCVNWVKFVTHEDALRYGELLTDDKVFGKPKGKSVLDIDWIRIRTVRYESRIFYHKMINGKVVEFKELTV